MLGDGEKQESPTQREWWKGIFLKIGAVLGGTPDLGPQGPKNGGLPQICPYRPLISYKIGQMPTVTRGG